MTGFDGLFHIDADGALTALHVTPYEAESVLQDLLSRYPDVLAGGQMDPSSPRRWLLISQEHGVPDREDATGERWSLDHLFVDQDAVPTLVEVKRSSDTRIRREVVGQMMDYAANGVLYWPVDRLREAFSRTQRETLGIDPDEAVRRLTEDSDANVEEFFDRVLANLRAGRVRLVFLADFIPDELRRIVEFLNEQMSPAEVFAVEVKQYTATGYAGRTIVPAVIGRTASASIKQGQRKAVDPVAVRRSASEDTAALAARLDGWAGRHRVEVRELPTSTQYRRPDGSGIGTLYYGSGTLDVDLRAVRERLGNGAAESVWAELQQLTSKSLTRQYPAVPTSDLLRDWDKVEDLLGRIVHA